MTEQDSVEFGDLVGHLARLARRKIGALAAHLEAPAAPPDPDPPRPERVWHMEVRDTPARTPGHNRPIHARLPSKAIRYLGAAVGDELTFTATGGQIIVTKRDVTQEPWYQDRAWALEGRAQR
jgi:hypothetical protein